MYSWTRARVAGIHSEPSVNLVISLCLRTLITLCGDRGVLVVLAEDTVSGIEERLLGGVESDEAVSSSENSVKVDMPLEEPVTDGAEFLKMLERRGRKPNSFKADTDG